MFAVHCDIHDARVLIWPSGVEAVRNTAEGIEVDYRCTCGARGTWRTGRRDSTPARRAAAAPVPVRSGVTGGGS